MTFTIGHVQGGTNAGRRAIREPVTTAWLHDCDSAVGIRWHGKRALQPSYTRCPDCGARRP